MLDNIEFNKTRFKDATAMANYVEKFGERNL